VQFKHTHTHTHKKSFPFVGMFPLPNYTDSAVIKPWGIIGKRSTRLATVVLRRAEKLWYTSRNYPWTCSYDWDSKQCSILNAPWACENDKLYTSRTKHYRRLEDCLTVDYQGRPVVPIAASIIMFHCLVLKAGPPQLLNEPLCITMH